MTVCPLPQSYTTCALGIQFVGYVMICFGAADALCSVLFGRLARHTGRTVLFALGRRVLGAAWGGSAALWAVAACVKRARVGVRRGVAGGTPTGGMEVRREAGGLPEGGDIGSGAG